jgi:ABC-type transporter Mla subunit MlaD
MIRPVSTTPKRKLLLTAIVVIGVASLALLLLKVPRYPLQIKTYLHSGQNLQAGSPVWIDGVTAGSVTAVNIRPEYGAHPVEIVMKIEAHFHSSIPQDSIATLSAQGVLGPIGLDIDTRNAHGPLIAMGGVLNSQEAEITGSQAAKAMGKIGNILIDASRDMQKPSASTPQ